MIDSSRMLNVNEIVTTLKFDADLKLLFVEGDRDLALWRRLVPIEKRNNSKIYKISSVEIDSNFGGERGRLLALSSEIALLNNNISERVKVFIDSDNDWIINKSYDSNVFLTDYRDLESYCFSVDCLEKAIDYGLAKSGYNVSELMSTIVCICEKIGFLRAISEKYGYSLGFGKIFNGSGRSKYIKLNKGLQVDFDRILNALIQNANLSLNVKEDIKSKLDDFMKDYANMDKRKIIHGKDWLFCLSLLLNSDFDSIDAIVFLSLDLNSMLNETSIININEYLIG